MTGRPMTSSTAAPIITQSGSPSRRTKPQTRARTTSEQTRNSPATRTGCPRRIACSVPLEITAGAVTGTVPELGVLIASSCGTSSAALCHRSAGRFSRQRMMTVLSAGGTVRRCCETGSGVWVIWAASSACAVGAVNGGRPVSISYASAPIA